MTIATPPASIIYDGTNDVTNWVKATVTGGSGAQAPTGSPALTTGGSAVKGVSGAPAPTGSPALPMGSSAMAGVSGAPTPTGGVAFTYYSGSSATGTPLSSSPIAAGTYTVVANYGGNGNYLPSQSSPVTFTIQAPVIPPSTVSVVSFKVNDGSPQRLMVDSLSVTFSSPVTLAAGAIALTTQGGAAVPFQLSTTDNTTYVLKFTGSQFIGGSLANGHYMLTINHALVSGPNGAVMKADENYLFFRLFGDYNGDGTVNNADYAIFRRHSTLFWARCPTRRIGTSITTTTERSTTTTTVSSWWILEPRCKPYGKRGPVEHPLHAEKLMLHKIRTLNLWVNRTGLLRALALRTLRQKRTSFTVTSTWLVNPVTPRRRTVMCRCRSICKR